MKKFAEEFQEKYSGISVEEETSYDTLINEDGEEFDAEITTYNVKSIPRLDGITLILNGESDFKRLETIIELKPHLFKDFLGGMIGKSIEVVLSHVWGSRSIIPMNFQFRALKPIKIAIGFKSRSLEIEIYLSSLNKTEIGFLTKKRVGSWLQRNDAIAKITGLSGKNLDELEADTQLVLRSILFDIECTYGIGFEIANFENLIARNIHTPVKKPEPPIEQINLLYKSYIPELIEYFHTGERVDHLPFKFICYFHIIEYFMDKSAHSVVTKKIKQIIMSPDFHEKSAEYISKAIKVFKAETEKLMTDKIKISRVFAEYLNKDEIQKFVENKGLKNHFERDYTLKFTKDLKINSIKFDADQSFCESLTKRIYAMRCSIVHSNPDFDESKAVPFSPTPSNLDFLRREIELIKEISRTIIVNSIV